MPPEIVVVGAGAAGIIASWRAAQLGAKVLLLEKNPRIGTKILVSGGGKCNITHDGELEDLLRAFRPAEARFIRPACYRFTNREIVKMLTSRGLEVYTRPDGRIFPVHQTAKDVVAILGSYLAEAGVEVRLSTPVKRIAHEGGHVVGVEVADGLISCPRV
ncbi:MAG TPA: NAD(P)/FAD-dependent oxidoreductase, partial [Fimbriimonadaceae bacterium]|nr:NAD(P)/FAD-dependent oxidoreductase [Fimbriimonadaceae bacterium]